MFTLVGSTRTFASAITPRLRHIAPLAACMTVLVAMLSPLGGCASSAPAANGSNDRRGEVTKMESMKWSDARRQLGSLGVSDSVLGELDEKFDKSKVSTSSLLPVADLVGLGVTWIAKRLDEEAASYEASFQAQMFLDGWFQLDPSDKTKYTKEAKCEIIRITRRTDKSGNKPNDLPAFELYIAVVPFGADSRIFTLKPIHLTIRNPKARIAGKAVNVTAEIAIDAGWYTGSAGSYTLWNDERLVVCSFNMVAQRAGAEPSWRWTCESLSKAPYSGYFPQPTPTDFRAIGRFSATVVEQDATKASENLRSAAQILRKNKEAIVDSVK
jgi:hypothetical protein